MSAALQDMTARRERAELEAAHDERVARRGYERALSDLTRLRDEVATGEGHAKRHAKCIPGLRMAVGWLERRLKETRP